MTEKAAKAAKTKVINKTQFLSKLAKEWGETLDRTRVLFNKMVSVTEDIFADTAAQNIKLVLTNFATFKRVKTKSREVINPRSRVRMQIKAKNTIKITAGKQLLDSVPKEVNEEDAG